MKPLLLDGRVVASTLRRELADRIQRQGLTPHLCIIQVGNDAASSRYIQQKKRRAQQLGITVTHEHCPEDILEDGLRELIESTNQDPGIHGIILQAPLPSHLSFSSLVTHIAPHKDVDGLHPFNQGGIRSDTHFFAPCTPRGIMELLHAYDVPLSGARVGIINRSIIVGRPLVDLLLNEDATVSVFHSKTPNLASLTAQCDVLISAMGRPEQVTPEYIKEGAVLIDVGCSLKDDHFVGDIHPSCYPLVRAYTPVPGGVGPLTVMFLLHNVVEASLHHR